MGVDVAVGVDVPVDVPVGVAVTVVSPAGVGVEVSSPPGGEVAGVATVGSRVAPAGVSVVGDAPAGGAVGEPTGVAAGAVTPGASVSGVAAVSGGAEGSIDPGSVAVGVKVGRAAALRVSLLRTASSVASVSGPESDEPHAMTEKQISKQITAENGVFRTFLLLVVYRLSPEL